MGAVIYGFSVIGSPFDKQRQKLDQTRLSDFSNLRYQIQTYYSSSSKLPDNLGQLTGVKHKDPESGNPYEYVITSATSFKLCAFFSTDSADAKDKDKARDLYLYDYNGTTNNNHNKGYDCISYDIPAAYQRSSYQQPYSADIYANVKFLVKDTPTNSGVFYSPKANDVFKFEQGNLISIKPEFVSNPLFLVDSSDNVWGIISLAMQCTPSATYCTSTWNAQDIFRSSNNGLAIATVESGTYYIAMTNASYTTLIAKSDNFTVK